MQPTHQTTRSAQALGEPPDTGLDSRSDRGSGALSRVDLSAVESEGAKLVCLYLAATQGGTVDDLHDDLDVPRLDLFTVLGTLVEDGHLDRDGQQYELA